MSCKKGQTFLWCTFQLIGVLVSLAKLSAAHSAPIHWNKSNLPCNQTLALQQVKDYLERDDFSEIMTNGMHIGWINPDTFYRNLADIPNICTSKEAILLQKYCWIDKSLPSGSAVYGTKLMQDLLDQWFSKYKWSQNPWTWPSLKIWSSLSRALQNFPLASGKMALHYCELVNAIPTEHEEMEMDYWRAEIVVYLLMEERESNQKSNLTAPQFGTGIKQQLEKETQSKREENAWKKFVIDSLTSLNTTLNEKLDKINDKINFFHAPVSDSISLSQSLESGSDFANCSTTCSRLAQKRSGAFTNQAIITCCSQLYDYNSGYCIQHVPVCTQPEPDATHHNIAECDEFCNQGNTQDSQIRLRHCCTLHGFPTGQCDLYSHAICAHFTS